jgi:hypothetical protein
MSLALSQYRQIALEVVTTTNVESVVISPGGLCCASTQGSLRHLLITVDAVPRWPEKEVEFYIPVHFLDLEKAAVSVHAYASSAVDESLTRTVLPIPDIAVVGKPTGLHVSFVSSRLAGPHRISLSVYAPPAVQA